MQKDLRGCRLPGDEQWKTNPVNGVNAAADREVAQNAEEDKPVNTAIEVQRGVHQGHPAECRSRKCAGCDEHQAAVAFWICPP